MHIAMSPAVQSVPVDNSDGRHPFTAVNHEVMTDRTDG